MCVELELELRKRTEKEGRGNLGTPPEQEVSNDMVFFENTDDLKDSEKMENCDFSHN